MVYVPFCVRFIGGTSVLCRLNRENMYYFGCMGCQEARYLVNFQFIYGKMLNFQETISLYVRVKTGIWKRAEKNTGKVNNRTPKLITKNLSTAATTAEVKVSAADLLAQLNCYPVHTEPRKNTATGLTIRK